MGKVIIKRSMLDLSITYAQLAVLSVNMKPGILLRTLEDFRLCRHHSRWLTGKGRDLEYSRGRRAPNDTDALGTYPSTDPFIYLDIRKHLHTISILWLSQSLSCSVPWLDTRWPLQSMSGPEFIAKLSFSLLLAAASLKAQILPCWRTENSTML
jgi:hypothetical protein